MKPLPAVDMIEVTRLTREGRLDEAMALLRGHDLAPPSENSAWGFGRVLDALPPSVERMADAARSWRGLPVVDTLSPPEGGVFKEHVFNGPAGSRAYKLYVPSRRNAAPLPLIMMLHGCSQSADDFATGTRMNEVAEELGLLVAYPVQSKSANASRCWNWFNGEDQKRGRGEPSLIAGMVQEIKDTFPVRAEQVYVAGLSAGGAAAAVLGETYPDMFAAVGVHSGLPCGAASDMASAFGAMRDGGRNPVRAASGVPTIVFHGDRDTTVNPVNGDRVIAQAGADRRLDQTVSTGVSAGGMRFTRQIAADASGMAVLEQWTLHGAGHAWSGGSPAGSFTDPRGPDASREMARFFLQHSLKRDRAPL